DAELAATQIFVNQENSLKEYLEIVITGSDDYEAKLEAQKKIELLSQEAQILDAERIARTQQQIDRFKPSALTSWNRDYKVAIDALKSVLKQEHDIASKAAVESKIDYAAVNALTMLFVDL